MSTTKQHLRLARKILYSWQARASHIVNDELTWRQAADAWTVLGRLRRQLRLAEDYGFMHCLESLRADLRWQLDQLGRALPVLHGAARSIDRAPGLAEWVQELNGLADEFGGLESDADQSTLRAVTEPVTLEGVELGPFAIELALDWSGRQRGTGCFRIVALDPNPATGREEVCHPHVNGDELCAGDANVPIGRALADGRLVDAFVLVRSVLTTYNPRSAYVRLDVWDGLTCDDCGDRVDRDESCSCPACGNDLCDHCASACRVCEETRCNGCLTTCDGCDDPCCSRCLERVKSGASLCSRCRDECRGCQTAVHHADLDNDALCESCREPSPTFHQPLLEASHDT
jgi:hypothetical protein